MSEQILGFLERAGVMISLVAMAVIVVGFVLSAVRYARRYRSTNLDANFQAFKIELGSALTLGLEVLILADVIESISAEPTFQSLGLLAFLVVVRTILSWTLSLEIEGRWPWQASDEHEGEQGHA